MCSPNPLSNLTTIAANLLCYNRTLMLEKLDMPDYSLLKLCLPSKNKILKFKGLGVSQSKNAK